MKKVLVRGQEKELDYRDGEFYLGDTHFDGHHVLWGFSYEPETYLKESELSGDEWREGGYVNFYKNGQKVYEEFCRKPDHAVFIVAEYLYKLMDFDWDYLYEGREIYWRDTPAKIGYIMHEQGAFMVHVDGAERFPDPVWADEDWQKLENPKEAKISIFDPHIWWWRK